MNSVYRLLKISKLNLINFILCYGAKQLVISLRGVNVLRL